MSEFEDSAFSHRAPYNLAEINFVLAQYCSSSSQAMGELTAGKGIDVTSRKEAILRSLSEPGELPGHIFGNLEMGLFNNNI